ncbi:HlyD family type I secretion periplasmic adaptor subunit [Rhodobacteraceae bacterium 2CG4]|uniref:Membrane fusion protein (MFP) family protein n=2 Tax=Halovulum marinum TaxID=2662447 RepID=A0A6L5Z2J9_9RHOB|nr:HlyD family type I secretion periplasmic adaptor subunit [Halovulum marinum]
MPVKRGAQPPAKLAESLPAKPDRPRQTGSPAPDDTRVRAKGARSPWSPSAPLRLGFVALVVLVFGIGGWSAVARISGAVISSGMVQVEGNRQAVQHSEGGLVGEILVRDGDRVQAGDVLLRLDDKLMRSDLAVIEGQLFELLARKSRLIAERDGAEDVAFSDELVEVAETRDEIPELMEGQRQLFRARRETVDKQTSQLRERIVQTENQVVGIEAQIAALATQRDLIAEELEDQQSLLDRGLTQQSKVLSLRRESARLEGELGELQSRAAQSKGQISETELEILRLQADMREQAISQLRDLEYNEIELRERRRSTLETLSRLEVRAPATGLVYSRQVNTVGAVVKPADVLMYIVPQEQPLVITSRIPTIHRDQVNAGQPATLRFPAFDQRTTPVLEGVVTKVSADAFTDETTGVSYYTAELLPLEGELQKIEGREIVPGMPVESYIRTGERTPMNYLLKPLTDYLNRAFREN